MDCPCNRPESDVTLALPLVVGASRPFPRQSSHTQIITRLVATGLELEEAERERLWRAIVKAALDCEFHPSTCVMRQVSIVQWQARTLCGARDLPNEGSRRNV